MVVTTIWANELTFFWYRLDSGTVVRESPANAIYCSLIAANFRQNPSHWNSLSVLWPPCLLAVLLSFQLGSFTWKWVHLFKRRCNEVLFFAAAALAASRFKEAWNGFKTLAKYVWKMKPRPSTTWKAQIMVHHDLYARCETLEFLDKKITETNFLGVQYFFCKNKCNWRKFFFFVGELFLHREGGGAQKGLLKLFWRRSSTLRNCKARNHRARHNSWCNYW